DTFCAQHIIYFGQATEQPRLGHKDFASIMNVHDENTGTQAAVDGAAAAEQQPDEQDVETLRSELAELAQKADEYLRLAQRSQADFINYRRRVEDERLQQAREATIAYIQRLLPVLDDFERALANAAPEDLESNWGKG